MFFLRRPLVGLGREDVRRRRRVLVVRIVRAREERVVLLRDARHLLVLREVVGLGQEAQAARLQGARGVGQELVGELEGVDAVLRVVKRRRRSRDGGTPSTRVKTDAATNNELGRLLEGGASKVRKAQTTAATAASDGGYRSMA